MGRGRGRGCSQEVTGQWGFEKFIGSFGGWMHKRSNVCQVTVMCQFFFKS